MVDRSQIKGTVGNESFEINVTDVTKAPNGQNLHKGIVQFGEATQNAKVEARVNKEDRRLIQKIIVLHIYYMLH